MYELMYIHSIFENGVCVRTDRAAFEFDDYRELIKFATVHASIVFAKDSDFNAKRFRDVLFNDDSYMLSGYSWAVFKHDNKS